MSSDLTGLLDTLRRSPQEHHGAIAERVQHLPPDQAQVLVAALRAEVLQRCAADGWLWLQFVTTRDEADHEQPTKPLPLDLPYLRPIWMLLTDPRQNRIICAKSRQMLMSWIVCIFACWWARFRPHQYVVIQTQKAEDGYKLVSTAGGKDATYLGRCQFIERNLPAWMRQTLREGEGELGYPNGSMIEALAGGADQIRSKVPSIIIEDEFAFQSESKGVYTAVNPLVQKGTKLIVVSTPNGFAGNMFAMLYHGLPLTDLAGGG